MSTLRILLLGPPAIFFDEKPLTIQRRALRSILFYLAHHKNMIDRASLILMLWPEVDDSTGRRRMRETLSKLRAELPDGDLLITSQDQVGLDRTRLDVDALKFDELFLQCNRVAASIPPQMPLPEHTYQLMKSAVELWRSPNFMSGVYLSDSETLDQWLSESRRQTEMRRVLLINRLADHCAASGDLEMAISWLMRIRDEEEDHLDWQVRYLTWLEHLGRRDDAFAFYNYLHQVYQESGETIPKALRVLFDQLRKQTNLPDIINHSFWPPPALIQTVFVGHEDELQNMKNAFQRGGIVSILGETGSGKTRLFHEFTCRYASEARLLIAPAQQSTRSLPYQPLLDMLRQSVSTQEWAALPPNWIAPLVYLMPELSVFMQRKAWVTDTLLEDPQGVVFESLHQVLRALSQTQRIILFLDDAQWCDQTTLDFLSYLVSRGFFDRFGLLVIAARPEDTNPSLKFFLNNLLHPANRALEIQINELTIDEASELISHVLGHSIPTEVARRLVETSSGFPLNLIETLRSILEYSPAIDLGEVIEYLPLPKSILELVRQRMETLSPVARKIIQVAAVIGGEFPVPVLEAAADLPPEQVVRALEEMERLHLVQPNSRTYLGASYNFLYGQIRRSVLLDLSEARKRLLHLAIAHAMQQVPGENQKFSVIAGHLEIAGELKGAYDYWVKAGSQAGYMYSRAETLGSFQRAETLLQHLGSLVSDEEIYRLFSVWGDFLDDHAEIPETIKLFYRLQQIAIYRNSNFLLATALNGLSRAFRQQDEYEKSLSYNRQAAAQLGQLMHIPETFIIHNRHALVLNLMGEYQQADEVIQKTMELAYENQSNSRIQLGLANGFVQMATVCNYKGLPCRTIALTDLAQNSSLATLDMPDVGAIRIARANAYFLMGRFQESYALCQEVMQKANELNSRRLEAHANMVNARPAMSLGMMDESLTNLENTLQLASQYNFDNFFQAAYCNLGDLYRMFGDYQRSLDAHQKGMELAKRAYYRLDNAFRLALSMIQLGDTQSGWRLLQETIKDASEKGFAYIALAARMMVSRVYMVEGDFTAAENELNDILEETDKHYLKSLHHNAHLHASSCALKQKQIQPAQKHLDMVFRFGTNFGYVWLTIPALLIQHEINLLTGKSSVSLREQLHCIQQKVLQNSRRDDLQPSIIRYFDQKWVEMQ